MKKKVRKPYLIFEERKIRSEQKIRTMYHRLISNRNPAFDIQNYSNFRLTLRNLK